MGFYKYANRTGRIHLELDLGQIVQEWTPLLIILQHIGMGAEHAPSAQKWAAGW